MTQKYSFEWQKTYISFLNNFNNKEWYAKDFILYLKEKYAEKLGKDLWFSNIEFIEVDSENNIIISIDIDGITFLNYVSQNKIEIMNFLEEKNTKNNYFKEIMNKEYNDKKDEKTEEVEKRMMTVISQVLDFYMTKNDKDFELKNINKK